MKEIKAYIHNHRIADVVLALKTSAMYKKDSLTGCRSLGVVPFKNPFKVTDPNDRQYYSLQLAQTVVDEFKLELVCEDKQVDELVALIKQASGMNPGIYVADIVFRGEKK